MGLYIALAVVVYASAALVPSSRTWIVAVQAVFVTWSLALFFLGIGRCCELRRTARRADTVRSMLTAYVRLKRHLANGTTNAAGKTAARRYLRLLRRQIEIVSHDGGFPMASCRRKASTGALSSSSSSSSLSTDFALSTDSFRAILSRHDTSQQPSSVRVPDCAAVEALDLEDEIASGSVLRPDATGSEPEVQNAQPGHDADAEVPFSPTRCSQQTWVFFDNRSGAMPADQLLAEIASASGRRATSPSVGCRLADLRRFWRAFGDGRRRLYERVRAEVADWLGMSGQLRLMKQYPLHRSSKSRLARSRSRASNVSAGARFSSYNIAQPVAAADFCGPDVGAGDVEYRKSRMVTSSSRLSESTCTELSLLSVPVLAGTCPTDDGCEISREVSRDDRHARDFADHHETGYTADTEPETARRDDVRRFRRSRDRVPSSDVSDNSTSGRRIELPVSTSRRLRMRRHIPDVVLLRRAMWAAVAVVSTTLFVCAIEVYAALGIYGVLSNERTVQSVWAWLLFQTLAR